MDNLFLVQVVWCLNILTSLLPLFLEIRRKLLKAKKAHCHLFSAFQEFGMMTGFCIGLVFWIETINMWWYWEKKRILMLLMLMMLTSLFLMRRVLNVGRTPRPCMLMHHWNSNTATSDSPRTGQGKEQARPNLLVLLMWRKEGLKVLWVLVGLKNTSEQMKEKV